MNRRRHPARGLALAACAAACAGSAVRAERFGTIEVSPLARETAYTSHGYLAHRVRIANSGAAPRTVLLVARGNGFGHHVAEIRRRIEVGAGGSAVVELGQPPLPANLGPLQVYLDGRRAGEVGFPYDTSMHGGWRSYRMDAAPVVLVSRSLNHVSIEARFLQHLNGGETPAPGSRSSQERRPVTFVRAENDTGSWSDAWLGYTRFDGIVLTGEDFRTAPDAVRRALWNYAECGGVLLLAGRVELPASARWPQEGTDALQVWATGFGRCLVAPEARPETFGRTEVALAFAAWRRTFDAGARLAAVNRPPPSFPVVEQSGLPVRTLLLLMLVFALLIGPVNLVVLHLRKRPIWMLWTIPAIATAATLMLIVYALLAEGITPFARAEAFTLLDQARHRAVTLGTMAWYCPLTPRGGLRFGYDTEVTPLVNRESGSGNARTVDWTRDQHLATGWVLARVPAAFLVRKPEARRERVQVGRDGERLTAVNGLGAALRILWVADAEGRLHVARDVPAGRQVTLAPDPSLRAEGEPGRLQQLLASAEWHVAWDRAGEAPGRTLWPGSYLAVLDDAPFLEDGLDPPGKTQRRSIVVGMLETGAAP